MNKQLRWIIVGLLLLSLSSIACALTGGDEEETAVEAVTGAVEEAVAEAGDTEAVTEAVEAAAEVVEEAGASEAVAELAAGGETINASELGKALDLTSMLGGETVQSYQYDMVMDISNDEGDSQSLITVLYSLDPPAMHMMMSFSGEAFAEDAEIGEMQMTQIGDSVYMDMPEMGCIQMPATDSSLTDEMMSDIFKNDIVDDLETVVKVGNETVNGVETIHYTFDETAFMDADDGMETAVGHIYVAKDSGYLIRMIIDGTGDVTDFSSSDDAANGTIHIEMNLTNLNEPVNIEAPTDCENFGDSMPFGGEDSGMGDSEPVDYPILDDATDVFSMAGITTYSTAMSVEDVLTFYQSELPAMGWVENPDLHIVVAGSASMMFNKDGKILSLTINDDPEAITSVVLFTMDE